MNPPELLERDDDVFVNYAGLDDDDDAFDELMSFRDKGYLREHTSLEQCSRDLGGPAILSKFGLIKRMKDGKLKKRIILDLKESSVTKLSAKTNRVVLPRLTDHVQSLLEEMQCLWGDTDPPDITPPDPMPEDFGEDDDDDDLACRMEQLILDFVDAF